ncbi:hypothetical protein ABIB73_007599 [Bradyrhizobium sp. F1.4.3]|uniref:hypothetical protein n=1 Tax=Bradyrhizobium sp. F1.4.3 TaxID=3156356 RepID=UPI00339426B2
MPDQIEIALAAAGKLEQESRQLERQWAFRVERAPYEVERARRQYDAVEPENRLVARSLERAWEEKLRVVEAVEQQHARWRVQEPLLIGPAERAGLQALGENLSRFGTRPPRRQPIASAFCDLSSAKWFLIRSGPEVKCGSRSSGRPAQPASIAYNGAFTPTAITPTLIGRADGSSS